jgi:DNA (cytosine-5)-methyltransferase 1
VSLAHVSLFAGGGGFDQGFERAGIPTVAWSEVDPHACAVMRHHNPDAVELGDVREITRDRIWAAVPVGHDLVISGGPPCQDFSEAGRRLGLAGTRSNLFYEYARVVAEAQPKWWVMENVPGMLSSNDGQDFSAVVRTLADNGFSLAWRICDSRYWAVPQRRRRVFIVGRAGTSDLGPRQVLDLCQGGEWDPCESITPQALFTPRSSGGPPANGYRACDYAGFLPGVGPLTARYSKDGSEGLVVSALTANGLGGGGPDDNLAQAGHLVVNTLQAPHRGFRADPDSAAAGHLVPYVKSRRAENADDYETWKASEVANTLNTFEHSAVRATNIVVNSLHLTQDPVSWEELSPALSGNAYLGVSQPTGVRRLTPLECERLQGWDDGRTAVGRRPNGTTYALKDSPRYRIVGNGVTSTVAHWIAARLLRVETCSSAASSHPHQPRSTSAAPDRSSTSALSPSGPNGAGPQPQPSA